MDAFLNRTAYDLSSIRSRFTKIAAGHSGCLDSHISPSCKLSKSPHQHWKQLLTHTSVGIFMGVSLMIYSTRVHFAPAFKKHGKAVPEQRLPPMIVGAIALPIALFWFGWTSSPNIIWVPQVISSAFIGMGMLVTFWQGMVSGSLVDIKSKAEVCRTISSTAMVSMQILRSPSTHLSARSLVQCFHCLQQICTYIFAGTDARNA
jgi:hypothetical protein